MKEKAKILFLSFCTTIVLTMSLDIPFDDELVKNQFRIFKLVTGSTGNSYHMLLLLVLLCLFYKFSLPKYRKVISDLRSKICCRVLASCFSLCMILGYSFETTNSWNLIFCFDNPVQIMKICLAIICYYILFVFLIADLYYYLDFSPTSSTKLKILQNHPFLISFAFFSLIFIPELIAAYPAVMMNDTNDEILQIFGLKGNISGYLNFISDTVTLNNHHPICYTLFLKASLWIGNTFFHSYNLGLFLCAIIQLFLVISVFSFAVKVLIKLHVPTQICVFLMVFVVLNSRILLYVIELTKDVSYTCFLFFFLMCLTLLFSGRKKKWIYFLGGISAIMMTLLRNDGIYIVVITLIVIFIAQKHLKIFSSLSLISVIIISILLHVVIMPALSVTPTSRREVLSLPFQQTTRYIIEYKDEVTKEEKEAISAVLDYDTILESFIPDGADYVKNTFNEDATDEEMKTYFKIWFKILKKHPGLFIEEALNMAYGYIYPLTNSSFYEENAQSSLILYTLHNTLSEEGIENDLETPDSLWTLRFVYEEIRETLTAMPGTSLLQCSATYSWMFLLWLVYCIRTKRRKSLVLLVPEFLILMVCFVSPITGIYFRYIFPVAVTLPFLIVASYYLDIPEVSKEIE